MIARYRSPYSAAYPASRSCAVCVDLGWAGPDRGTSRSRRGAAYRRNGSCYRSGGRIPPPYHRVLPVVLVVSGSPLRPVAHGDQDATGTRVLPARRGPVARTWSLQSRHRPRRPDVAFFVHGDAPSRQTVGRVAHPSVTDLDNRSRQRRSPDRAGPAGLLYPVSKLPGDLLGDPGWSCRCKTFAAVDLADARDDPSGRESTRCQRQHDLVDAAQASLALRDDHRLERPTPAPSHHSSDMPSGACGPVQSLPSDTRVPA